MRSPHVNDTVRLTKDVPELLLHRGEVGIVRSTWFAPAVAYEVEFRQSGAVGLMLALLRDEQIEVEDTPPSAEINDAASAVCAPV
jgi:hypothetical protein